MIIGGVFALIMGIMACILVSRYPGCCPSAALSGKRCRAFCPCEPCATCDLQQRPLHMQIETKLPLLGRPARLPQHAVRDAFQSLKDWGVWLKRIHGACACALSCLAISVPFLCRHPVALQQPPRPASMVLWHWRASGWALTSDHEHIYIAQTPSLSTGLIAGRGEL